MARLNAKGFELLRERIREVTRSGMIVESAMLAEYADIMENRKDAGETLVAEVPRYLTSTGTIREIYLPDSPELWDV